MIYLVEDDESIRELVVYTLKSQGMDAKGFERPSLFWKELEKEITGADSSGYHASGRRRNIYSAKTAYQTGCTQDSGNHADGQRYRV